MPSVSQFVSSVKLDKADETLLTQHIQECHDNASGPSLHDKCTNRVRYVKTRTLHCILIRFICKGSHITLAYAAIISIMAILTWLHACTPGTLNTSLLAFAVHGSPQMLALITTNARACRFGTIESPFVSFQNSVAQP